MHLPPIRSEQLHELFAALAKAQADMNFASLTNNNPFFKSKYADLAEYIRVSRPMLTKHNLCVIQQLMTDADGVNVLHTLLGHASGQYIESRIKIIPPKSDIQSLGSYITYLRRYSYAALVGLTSSGEDDDGEQAMVHARTLPKVKVDLPPTNNERITKEQLEQLYYELNEFPHIEEKILDAMHISQLSDMPKNRFLASIKRIKEIKDSYKS